MSAPQRVAAEHQGVDAQVELEAMDEEGFGQVVLRHHVGRVHLLQQLSGSILLTTLGQEGAGIRVQDYRPKEQGSGLSPQIRVQGSGPWAQGLGFRAQPTNQGSGLSCQWRFCKSQTHGDVFEGPPTSLFHIFDN